MSSAALDQQKDYLAQLLEAVQRCAWFLDQSCRKINWPLNGATLTARAKDPDLFETLAAINERFAKLQDSLAAAMRHTALLIGEDTSYFLKAVTLLEKLGVLSSTRTWQQARLLRNHAAHDHDLACYAIAANLNAVRQLIPDLFLTAHKLLAYVSKELDITPATNRFSNEFEQLQY